MHKIIKAGYRARRTVRSDSPARSVSVDQTDVFVTSYPRSGNSWIRFMLTAVLCPDEPLTRDLVKKTVPDIYTATPREIANIPMPRILKSHEYFDPRYRKVAYAVRDPRDVAVSYFHFHRLTGGRGSDLSLERFVERMVEGSIDHFGTWREHVVSWLCTRSQDKGFLLLKYEDLLERPQEEAERLVDFVGLRIAPQDVDKAVEAASFESMKKIASRDISPQRQKLLARRGIGGSWRDELPESSVKLIESAFHDAMQMLGYA